MVSGIANDITNDTIQFSVSTVSMPKTVQFQKILFSISTQLNLCTV